MNKNAWIALGAVVVIVAAIGFWYKGHKNPEMASESSTSEQKSLKDLLTSGSPEKCTFEDTESTAKTQGTVYTANGKMRGDFSATAGGQTYAGHMIIADNVMNTWVDGMSTGFKIALTAAQTEEASRGLDANKKMDYHCEAWSANSSLFVLPTTVKFTDMSAAVSGSVSGTTGTTNTCAACNNVPDAYKAQCRASLGCK